MNCCFHGVEMFPVCFRVDDLCINNIRVWVVALFVYYLLFLTFPASSSCLCLLSVADASRARSAQAELVVDFRRFKNLWFWTFHRSVTKKTHTSGHDVEFLATVMRPCETQKNKNNKSMVPFVCKPKRRNKQINPLPVWHVWFLFFFQRSL